MSAASNSINPQSIAYSLNDFLAPLGPSASIPLKPDPYAKALEDLAGIPQTLKERSNWVGWKSIVRDGKLTKVPFNVLTGTPAKANDPSTWTTFEHAVEVTTADPSKYDGIGFELGGTSIVGIDFDNAVNAGGAIDPYASAILKLLRNPYCEISPSGTGLHTFVECDALPEGGRKLSQGHTGIEIYHGREGGRYFTMTGQRVFGDGVPTIPDMSLPYLLITQNKDKTFKSLWLGDTATVDGGDDSSADFALMCRLAALTKGDREKMEKFFGASTLGQREKWTDRADYRASTIKAAIEKQRIGKVVQSNLEFHTPARPESSIKHVLEPLAHREDGWFDIGGVSLLGGSSGVGKTTFLFELLHKQKQGYPFLGHQTHKLLFHVLTVDRPPKAYDATITRLRLLPTDIPRTQLPMVHDLAAAQAILDEVQKMTPIPNIIFVEGLDMLSSNQNDKVKVSVFMRHLQDVAKHLQISIIGSLGASKVKRGQEYGHKRDQIAGSEAWGRLADTVVVLSFSEDDDGTGAQREMSVLLREASAEPFSLRFESGRLALVQATPQNERHGGGRPAKNLQKAVAFLKRKLQGEPEGIMLQKLIREAQEEDNISRGRLYEAADDLGIDREHAEEVKLTNGRITRLWKLCVAGATEEAITL
jgi:hypothetical protein